MNVQNLRPATTKSLADRSVGASGEDPAGSLTAEPDGPKRSPELKIPAILLEDDAPPPRPVADPAARFAVAPPGASQAEPVGADALPAAYGTGKLWLTARSPASLYASWDLDPAQQRQYLARARQHHLVLRLHPESTEGPAKFEIALEPEAQHAFVPVEPAGAKNVAVLGFYSPANDWVTLATSEPAVTPRGSVADDTTVQFATMPPSPAPAPPRGSTPELAFPARTTQETASVGGRTEARSQSARSVEPVAVSPAKLPAAALAQRGEPVMSAIADEPLPPFIQARFAEAKAGNLTAEAQILERNLRSAANPIDSNSTAWSAAQEQALAEEIGEFRYSLEGISSADIAELVRRRRGLAAAPQAAALPGITPLFGEQAGEFPAAVPQEGLSSPAGGELVPRQGFWLGVNAELILYGGTEPDASVTIAGRAVQLQADGSFSCRFALPDGEYELTVRAVSAGQEQRREAQLRFSRHTDYRE
jgi:hypothetical protein